MILSHSLEDYLEAIAHLEAQNGAARANDIAVKLKVRMPSVTTALRTLSERGHITYQSYHPIHLTRKGRAAAKAIIQRHVTLYTFFHEVLSVPETEANEIACGVEHHISNALGHRIERLNQALLHDFPEVKARLTDPALESVVPDERCVTLDKLRVGETAVITEISDRLPGLERFAELGLLQGARLKLEESQTDPDTLRVRITGTILTLRKAEAGYIRVTRESLVLPVAEAL